MLDTRKIWTALLKAERKARSSKAKRFIASPVTYPFLMGFNQLYYPVFRRGLFVETDTFFGVPMKTLLPAGTDIVLNGIKSHDAEIRLTKFLAVQLKGGDTFIDIGAHYGYYSLLASVLVGENGHVYAVEASLHSYEILRANTVHATNITTYHNAAGETPGEITFYEYPGPFAEYNTIVKDAYEGAAWFKKVKQTINKVQTIVLDNLIADNEISKAIIKIDVEGGELSVIKGLSQSLREKDLTIVMEYLLSKDLHSPHHQAVEFMTEQAYNVYAIDKDGVIVPVTNVDQYLEKSGLDSDNLVFKKD